MIRVLQVIQGPLVAQVLLALQVIRGRRATQVQQVIQDQQATLALQVIRGLQVILAPQVILVLLGQESFGEEHGILTMERT